MDFLTAQWRVTIWCEQCREMVRTATPCETQRAGYNNWAAGGENDSRRRTDYFFASWIFDFHRVNQINEKEDSHA
jgi:hypothetical protein